MNKIEHKFAVIDSYYEDDFYSYPYAIIKKGYFDKLNPYKRIKIFYSPDTKDRASITIKSKEKDLQCFKFEYEIPVDDAHKMLSMYCENRIVVKSRYFVNYENFTWHVDFYHGFNKSLTLTKVELECEVQKIKIPKWVGKEINGQLISEDYNLALNNEKMIEE